MGSGLPPSATRAAGTPTRRNRGQQSAEAAYQAHAAHDAAGPCRPEPVRCCPFRPSVVRTVRLIRSDTALAMRIREHRGDQKDQAEDQRRQRHVDRHALGGRAGPSAPGSGGRRAVRAPGRAARRRGPPRSRPAASRRRRRLSSGRSQLVGESAQLVVRRLLLQPRPLQGGADLQEEGHVAQLAACCSAWVADALASRSRVTRSMKTRSASTAPSARRCGRPAEQQIGHEEAERQPARSRRGPARCRSSRFMLQRAKASQAGKDRSDERHHGLVGVELRDRTCPAAAEPGAAGRTAGRDEPVESAPESLGDACSWGQGPTVRRWCRRRPQCVPGRHPAAARSARAAATRHTRPAASRMPASRTKEVVIGRCPTRMRCRGVCWACRRIKINEPRYRPAAPTRSPGRAGSGKARRRRVTAGRRRPG